MTISQIEKSWRFRVATAGATAVSGNVDFTETGNISGVREVGGQRVEALRSRSSARPWSVDIVDASESVTGQLADADGRAHLMRRLCDLSVSTDGGNTWTVLATGRVADIEMMDVAAFRFSVQDERLIERTTTLWTGGNTTRLFPRGLDASWHHFVVLDISSTRQGARRAPCRTVSVDATNNKTRYIPLADTDGELTEVEPFQFSQRALDLLEDDVVEDPAAHQNNFKNLKVNVDGTDYGLELFGDSPATDPLKSLRDKLVPRPAAFNVAGVQGTQGEIVPVYFHMQGVEPSDELPLHIGGQNGIDPFTLVKHIYDNTALPNAGVRPQDSSNASTIRYDSTVFSAYDATTNPDGLIDNPRFRKMHFRITRPQNMAQWLEDNIYGPLGVTPFVNEDGEVSPKIGRLPASDQLADPTNLFEFDADNTRKPHPTWANRGREQVTVLETNFLYAYAPNFEVQFSGSIIQPEFNFIPLPSSDSTGSDLLAERDQLKTREHDRASNVRVVHEMDVTGIQSRHSREAFADEVAEDIFERFGDAPVLTTVHGMSGTESVRQGDWVLLNLASYPNLASNSRGGKRILQVIDRIDTPKGPRFELLDAGPNSQPLTAPTVGASANSNDAHNALDVAVSGLSAGESYVVHLSENATEPTESSDEWQYETLRGTANETVTVRGVPSGSKLWARARATAPGRIGSDWSTSTSHTTTSLSAPTGATTSTLSGDTAVVAWTNGETDFDVQVDLDGNFEARLGAGATEYEFTDLTPSTSFTAGVRHVDDFGGESSRATTSFTTTGTATTAPDMRGIRVLVGGD